jgi:hypothetical protein
MSRIAWLITIAVVAGTLWGLQATHGVVSGVTDSLLDRGRPQPVAATTSQILALEHTPTGSALAAVGYAPDVTIRDRKVPGGHFEIWIACTAALAVKSGPAVVGMNYTKNNTSCASSYLSKMTASHPGVVVDNAVDKGGIVALLLPDGKGNYYWIAVPRNTKSPTSWEHLRFPKAHRAQDVAALLAAVGKVPAILEGDSSDTIGVAPFPASVRVRAGRIAVSYLDPIVVQLTH